MNHFGDMTYDEIVDVMLPLAKKYCMPARAQPQHTRRVLHSPLTKPY